MTEERTRPETERVAWEAMIRTHGPRVLAHLVASGVRIDQAKELANDAWTKLLESQREGRLTMSEMKMPGLILRQATFLAIDAARRRRLQEMPLEAPEAVDEAPGIEEVLTSREQLERARTAFDGASRAEQRIFLALYEQPHLTAREIADQLALSPQRVKQVAYEIRKRIRTALEEEDR